ATKEYGVSREDAVGVTRRLRERVGVDCLLAHLCPPESGCCCRLWKKNPCLESFLHATLRIRDDRKEVDIYKCRTNGGTWSTAERPHQIKLLSKESEGMKLATVRTTEAATAAVLALDGAFVTLPYPNVGVLLADPDWRAIVEAAAQGQDTGTAIDAGSAVFAPLLPEAAKVICCGLNYGDHIQEMGRDLPQYPTLFAKHAHTLTGPMDIIDIWGSEKVDWEAELAIVVGRPLFRATEEQAKEAIAGYTVANDVSMRDWQNRTLQWFQGKAFDRTTPVGPVLVPPEEAPGPFEVRG